jgi:hypothetical protein
MQPIDLTNVTSVILSTPYDKPLEVSAEVVKTIFELGIDIRDKILALKKEENKPLEAMEDKKFADIMGDINPNEGWEEEDRLNIAEHNACLLALEFGYKQCEKGNNLEMAFINYNKIINQQ